MSIMFGVPSTPSIVELLERLAALETALAQANRRIETLEAENAELRRRLGQNPRNSNTPPSVEGLGKPAPKSLRKRSGRRPGGQAGHEGSTLRQVDRPDVTRRHEPRERECAGCGEGLAGAAQVGLTRRQVFEIPRVQARVTEHQLVARRCGCGTVTCGQAPAGVDAPVQYGTRLTAVVVYLLVAQFGAQKRVAQAVADLFGVPISTGSVAAISARAADGLAQFLDLVRDRVAGSAVAHFDETGMRVAGRLHWVHSASTGKYSLVYVHPKRGREAMDEIGVLPGFAGIAVHDAWAPYDCYPAAIHSLCCAHLIRELVAAVELDATATWAQQGIDALATLKQAADHALADGADGIDPRVLAEQVDRFRHAALVGVKHHDRQRTKIGKKLHALPDGCATVSTTTCGSHTTCNVRSTTTPPSGKSTWSNSGRKSPAAYAPSPARSSSALSAPTWPLPPSMTSTCSTH
jgi:transposase